MTAPTAFEPVRGTVRMDDIKHARRDVGITFWPHMPRAFPNLDHDATIIPTAELQRPAIIRTANTISAATRRSGAGSLTARATGSR